MEINKKIIPFPFWRHINYANYMRKNKRLPIIERKKDENTSSINVISIINNRKR